MFAGGMLAAMLDSLPAIKKPRIQDMRGFGVFMFISKFSVAGLFENVQDVAANFFEFKTHIA
jgi:hypothetical protein